MTKAETYSNALEEPRARKGMIERMESLDKMMNPNYFYSRYPDRQAEINEIRNDFEKLIERFKQIPFKSGFEL